MYQENLSKLSETVDLLSSNWTIPDLREDFEELAEKFKTVTEQTQAITQTLPHLHKCYKFQTDLLEVLAWVQELLAVLESEYYMDDEEQIAEELEKLKVGSLFRSPGNLSFVCSPARSFNGGDETKPFSDSWCNARPD